MKNKAIFLDRDGIITKLIYNTRLGIIHTILNPKQVEFVFGALDFLKTAKKNGYLLIIISNQPNVGIKKINIEKFLLIKKKINSYLKKNGIVLDAEYYGLHHPFADIKKYRKICKCRKPETLLYKKAINKFDIDVKKSWAVGDGIFDIIAGNKIGLKTILVTNTAESAYFEMIINQLKENLPHGTVKNLQQAQDIIFKEV